ncbi:hypothetical protein [Bernardetia sp.]|uniref:hypothetical protein n=1 Tax=Bernardetia sp. TaxID=1937974 RepID=UPI0025C1547A|nr:hypothetical protein [Bernardetia sp.]
MNTTFLQSLKINKQFLLLSIPLFLLAGLVYLIHSPYFLSQSESFIMAISVDFVITIPIIYFLVIRKTKIPNFTAITLMIIGLFLGLYVLPQDNQIYLQGFKEYFFPFVELGILSIVIWKVRTAIKKYKSIAAESSKTTSFDFFTVLKNSCEEILPKLPASLLATEVAVIYYSIINWKKTEIHPAKEFTYHKNSGTVGLLGALVFIIAVETIALHLLLAEWNLVVAWVLTILSIYTGFQIMAFAKSFSKRPILIENDTLYLRYGIMSETEIKIENIVSIETSEKPLEELIETEVAGDKEKRKLYQKLSPLSELEAHNVVIRLNKKAKIKGVYGMNKEAKTLALFVDKKQDFVEAIQNQIR